MKKNILFIVIDSVTNDVLFNKSNSKKIAPFLSKLRNESISGDKMYSEAPYTEAALMSLLASVDTMDNGGYMERLKTSKCVLEFFQKHGYKVFFNTYYPSIYPSCMVKGYDEKKYIEGFQFVQLWEYRLKYFSEIFANDKLTEEEEKMLVCMLEDNFKAWMIYFKKISTNNEETVMLNDCIDITNIQNDIELLNNEYDIFKKDKYKYLENLLRLKEEHPLFKIKTYKMTDKVHSADVRNIVMNKYENTFKKIASLDFKYNLLNNSLPLKKLCNSVLKRKFSTTKGVLAGYKNSLFDKDLYERIGANYDQFKAQRSFYTVSQELFKWIKNNENENWMSYVHIDDAHYTENFFTYDTNDINVIDSDFKRIDNYLNNIPKDYKGSIAYDLSLMYCDNIIKNIFDFLESEKLLNNTSVVITADHGFSYYFSPVREKYVISSYRENYNVPFIVYDKSIKHKMIKNYCSTKDIPATLLDLANIPIPKDFKGKSLLKYNGDNYALLEYMGGGCPDVKRRPIILGVRTDNYDIIMDIYIDKKFDDNIIKEVYDIKKDPFEHNNLVNNKNIKEKIQKELKILKKRYDEIICEYEV